MRLRTVLSIVAGLAVVAIGAVAAILLTTDFNRYRGLIAEQVKQATGRDVAIGGDFRLAISLSPTVAVNDVTLANAEWGSRPQMATLRRLEAEMELLPLLSGEIRIRRIILVGADILLESDKEGRANWVFGEPASEPPPAEPKALRLPTVNEVLIEDSTLVYRDGAMDTIRTVKLARLAASADSLASPVKLEVDGAVNGAPVKLSGTFGALQFILDGKAFPIELKGESNGALLGVIGKIEQPLQGGGIDVAVTAEGESLADLSLFAGLPLPPIGPYDLAATLSNPEGTLRITRLRARVGTSDFTGDVVLPPLGGGRPRIEAKLASEKLDFADFGLASAPAGEGGGAGQGDGRVFPADPLPLGGLEDFDAAIELTAGQLIKQPVTMSNVSAALALADGKLTISRFESGLAGGTLGLTGSLDAGGRPAVIAAKLKARGVEAGALLQTLAISDVLGGGKANLDLDIRGRGNSMRAIMAGLNGASSLEMGPGQIDNTFARLLFADLFNLISFGGEGDSSNLNCVVARFDFAKGLATSRGLVIDTAGGTILGGGTVNLADERLDLLFDPNAKLTSLTNFAVPTRVRGTLASPSVSPDPAGVAELVAKGVLIGATGGVFAALAGLSSLNALENAGAGNPCVAALAEAGKADAEPQSVPDQVIEGAGDALEGVGSTLEGVGDTIEGLFE